VGVLFVLTPEVALTVLPEATVVLPFLGTLLFLAAYRRGP